MIRFMHKFVAIPLGLCMVSLTAELFEFMHNIVWLLKTFDLIYAQHHVPISHSIEFMHMSLSNNCIVDKQGKTKLSMVIFMHNMYFV